MISDFVTGLERKVIEVYMNDDLVSDRGWNNIYSSTYVKDFHLVCDMEGKIFSGVMASLYKKGLINCNGETFKLTEEGMRIASKIEINNKPTNLSEMMF